jgi:DNA-binding CsgD family transcriptional regulator
MESNVLERSSNESISAAGEAEAFALVVRMRQRMSEHPIDAAGEASSALDLIESCIREVGQRNSVAVSVAQCAQAVMFNGQRRYEIAHLVAERASRGYDGGQRAWALGECVEGSVRAGKASLAWNAFARLQEQLSRRSDDWAQGLLARSQALLAGPDDAEPLYREAVSRFARAGLELHRARARLLYGEWLRRVGRRVAAREQLLLAERKFTELGFAGFAERANLELAATCPSSRKRSFETRDDLTAQEAQVARLAGSGRTNSEIGTILFLSPRTVEWHLRKVFAKLGITSRRALRSALDLEALPVSFDAGDARISTDAVDQRRQFFP